MEWINRELYLQVVSEPGYFPAITPGCIACLPFSLCHQNTAILPANLLFQSCLPDLHFACQSIARLLHQSASGVECNVCVIPPACVYSLLIFNYLTLIFQNCALVSSVSLFHPSVLNIILRAWSCCMILREGCACCGSLAVLNWSETFFVL